MVKLRAAVAAKTNSRGVVITSRKRNIPKFMEMHIADQIHNNESTAVSRSDNTQQINRHRHSPFCRSRSFYSYKLEKCCVHNINRDKFLSLLIALLSHKKKNIYGSGLLYNLI